MLHCLRVLCLLALTPGAALAQDFDIWLFDRNEDYRLVDRVTDREGYDNQPAFTTDAGALLFSSDRAGGATDVFRWELADGTLTNLTDTPDENEYSPQSWGPDHFMYVLQEGVPYQHLWIEPWSGGERERVLTSYVPAAYYARNDVGVLFWGRYTNSIFFEPAGAEVGAAAGESLFVLEDTGRSLHSIPGTEDFSFVHKQDWGWIIRRFDPATGAMAPLAPIPPTNEDYCWTPDGFMLTAAGSTLVRFRPGQDTQWELEAELRAEGFEVGGRCAVSPDGRYLAIVGVRG